MKIIFFGATGFIGGHVLTTVLADDRVKEVITVSRRPLADSVSNSKLKLILMSDFLKYAPDTVAELATANACIWCLGTYNGDVSVEVEYPQAFFEAMTGQPAWRERNGKGSDWDFRFVYLGGAFTVTDQTIKLWWLEKARKVRGRAQTMVLDWEKDERARGKWSTVVLRPAGVGSPLWKQNIALKCLRQVLGDGMVVGVDEVAEVMIQSAMPTVKADGEKEVDSREIARHGRTLLAVKSSGIGSEQ